MDTSLFSVLQHSTQGTLNTGSWCKPVVRATDMHFRRISSAKELRRKHMAVLLPTSARPTRTKQAGLQTSCTGVTQLSVPPRLFDLFQLLLAEQRAIKTTATPTQ
eukprot:Plantae.Rhodophyta-Purpureofilum_apyrenoidigerum.ctg1566.p1 GENE.Plantae.Rhodophyta-Purpureofilum_apyrenoidigerum.ctg1566~~Plantae.Rhodophyta-Purpureofilum_apyrenoidigerum.ctg1566.p1  ORF type:complete len:105 (-),score=0.26 Plantae.Rhodophyta-Purpureofilum_apyrenoidigerum.ctg1566:303-617(-)